MLAHSQYQKDFEHILVKLNQKYKFSIDGKTQLSMSGVYGVTTNGIKLTWILSVEKDDIHTGNPTHYLRARVETPVNAEMRMVRKPAPTTPAVTTAPSSGGVVSNEESTTSIAEPSAADSLATEVEQYEVERVFRPLDSATDDLETYIIDLLNETQTIATVRETVTPAAATDSASSSESSSSSDEDAVADADDTASTTTPAPTPEAEPEVPSITPDPSIPSFLQQWSRHPYAVTLYKVVDAEPTPAPTAAPATAAPTSAPAPALPSPNAEQIREQLVNFYTVANGIALPTVVAADGTGVQILSNAGWVIDDVLYGVSQGLYSTCFEAVMYPLLLTTDKSEPQTVFLNINDNASFLKISHPEDFGVVAYFERDPSNNANFIPTKTKIMHRETGATEDAIDGSNGLAEKIRAALKGAGATILAPTTAPELATASPQTIQGEEGASNSSDSDDESAAGAPARRFISGIKPWSR